MFCEALSPNLLYTTGNFVSLNVFELDKSLLSEKNTDTKTEQNRRASFSDRFLSSTKFDSSRANSPRAVYMVPPFLLKMDEREFIIKDLNQIGI